MTIRVLIADDQMLARQGLRALLQSTTDVEVVGEATNGREAVKKAQALRPHVVLMNVMMPEMDGIDAARVIRTHAPETQVLMLTVSADEDLLHKAVKSGAVGYVHKDISPEDLVRTIRSVHNGKSPINPQLARKMVERVRDAGQISKTAPARKLHGLTAREVEVLTLVARGLGDKEIALKLYLSESTVKTHLRSIYQRLNVRNRAQAAAFAVEHSLVDL